MLFRSEYTDAGFSPQTITITAGETVLWTNRSSKLMWVASAKHPDHTVYDGTSLAEHCADGALKAGATSFDQCTAVVKGSTYSFVFDKLGTWKYHDHVNATKFGTVIVTAQASSTPI